MTRVMARYRVTPEHVAENERYIKKVSSSSIVSSQRV
jgi:hypothetical protein